MSVHCTMDAETGKIYQIFFLNESNYADYTESNAPLFDTIGTVDFTAAYAAYLGFSLEQSSSQEFDDTSTTQFLFSSDGESLCYRFETAGSGSFLLFAFSPFYLEP